MSVLQVACPGCQSPLKAPESMAGKKAKCKRCGTSFRLPGGVPDSVGESQLLSAMDLPAPAKPAAPPPPPPPAPAEEVFAAVVAEEPVPTAAVAGEPVPTAAVAAAPDPLDPFADDPPAPAAGGNAFSFDDAPAKPAGRAAKSGVRPRPHRDPAPADGAPAPRRPAAQKAGGGLVKVAVIAGVLALVGGGAVGGLLVYLNNKPAEQAKADKKSDPAPADPAPAPKDEAKDKEKEKEKEATPKDAGPKTNKGKDAGGKTTPGKGKTTPVAGAPGGGGMLALKAGKAIAFPAKPAAPKLVAEAITKGIPIEVAFAEVRRFFPPQKAEADIGVVWRSNAGFQGAGEKITLSRFSRTGLEIAKLEADGDGGADAACDLSADGKRFAVGHRVNNKVTVFDVAAKTRLIDGFDPYAALPDKKDVKLAAVFLTEPPDRLVTVSSAGVVHVWDIATKAPAGTFAPARPTPGKVATGRAAAAAPNRQSVVVAAGGVVYQVATVGPVGGSPLGELGGDVGRSLALAVSPSGKVIYGFETDADGKKDQALALLGGGAPKIVRLPADAGEPVAAGWCADVAGAVWTKGGCAACFVAEEGAFAVGVLVLTPEGKGVHAAADNHWTLYALPGDGKRCAAVEIGLPPDGIGDQLIPADRRPPATVVLGTEGLSQ